MSESAIRPAPPSARLRAETARTAGLDDLIRVLGHSYARAQARLGRRQEELEREAMSLRIKLPDGTEAVLSAPELCGSQRCYLADMVVDLRCAAVDIQTVNGMHTALRVLPGAASHADALAVQIAFTPGEPVRAELRFARKAVRTVLLSAADLQSAEPADAIWSAQLYLIDTSDAAQIPASARIAQPVSQRAAPPRPDVSGPMVQAAEVTTVPPTEKPAAPTPPILRRRQRGVLLGAGLSLVGLCALTLGIWLGTKRLTAPGPRLQSRRPAARYEAAEPPPDLGSPVAQSRVADLGERAAPAHSELDADAGRAVPEPLMPATGLLIGFYYDDSDQITQFACNGQPVLAQRETGSNRWVARVLLRPGSRCLATGLGKQRVYTYELLRRGKPWRHVRFSNRRGSGN